jgi:hypothetical protein
MGKTTRYDYRGWDITIRCMPRVQPDDELPRATQYSAVAHAELNGAQFTADWIDPRTQIVTLGSRLFFDGNQCVEILLADVKELIDALRK